MLYLGKTLDKCTQQSCKNTEILCILLAVSIPSDIYGAIVFNKKTHTQTQRLTLTGTCCTWGAMAWTVVLPEVLKREEVVVSPWMEVWMVIGWTIAFEDDRVCTDWLTPA